jgi:hypothetical protein
MAATPPWAWSPSFASANGEVYHATGYDYEIAAYGIDGSPRRQIRLSVPSNPIAPDEMRALIEGWRLRTRLLPDTAIALIERLPVPRHRPVIAGLFASAFGDLAVVRRDLSALSAADGDSVVVDILSNGGAVRGQTALPPGSTVHAFTGTHLYIVVALRSGVGRAGSQGTPEPEQVVRYRLEPIPRGSR